MTRAHVTLACQLVAGVLLLVAAAMKLRSDPDSVAIFVRLGMEPAGRYIIAGVELAAGLMLLSPLATLGALLAVCVMAGALIAHLTQLGIVVNDDGGALAVMLFVVLACSLQVLVARRSQLPRRFEFAVAERLVADLGLA